MTIKTFVDTDTRTGEQLLEDLRAGQPTLVLVGGSGNAFAIMGAVSKAVKSFGREYGYSGAATAEASKLMQDKLTAGNYEQLIGVVMDYFDVE